MEHASNHDLHRFDCDCTDITVLAVYVPQGEGDPASIQNEVRLAEHHGISGFAVIHDLSKGHLSEGIFDVLASQSKTFFSFMAICVYDRCTSPEQSILSLAGYMQSDGYFKINGKPVIGVDNPQEITEAGVIFDTWRSIARENGIGEILIWACSPEAGIASRQDVPKREVCDIGGIDAFYEFPPRGKDYAASCKMPDGGTVHDYGSLIEGARWFYAEDGGIPVYRGCMLEWDDCGVNQDSCDYWYGFSPERFYLWNRINIRFLREHYRSKDRILLVNAWNDREHGTVLEPNREYGRACLEALSRAVYDLPYNDDPKGNSLYYLGAGSYTMQEDRDWYKKLDQEPLIAVHVHVFYPELIEEVLDFVSHIPFRFDLYLSSDSEEKTDIIFRYVEGRENVFLLTHPNRGRDIVPLLSALRETITRYRYVCHIHTKKSRHIGYGNAWRRYLFRNLLGSETLVREILYMFEREPDLGLVFPQSMDLIRAGVKWKGNRERSEALMSRMGFPDSLPKKQIIFPAGNMFWARVDAVRQMFTMGPVPDEFPEEQGQVEGTLMHAIERIWCYLAGANGYRYRITRYLGDNRPLDLLKI